MALFNNKQFVGLAIAGVLTAWYLKSKAGQVIQSVNPMNQENVINQGAEKAFTAATGIDKPPGAAAYDAMKGDRDEWTMARTDEIIWERHANGQELDPVSAMGQARYEWNRDHAKWWKVGDSWSKDELKGYEP